MPDDQPAELRIYCICGQKMKVSEEMFGRPGKCIACRQKIRVPERSQVPDDTGEVYLKDHPEFLRQTKPPSLAQQDASDQEEDNDDLPLGDLPGVGANIPLDVLEPLRTLCSFEYAVVQQLEALRKGEEAATDKATLMGYRALVNNARANLDEQMRERLHEVADQLAGTVEQIARATLAVRIGEMDYATFMDSVVPLRQRRERLERRRENLRGWLAVEDPYLAGGLVDVQLADVPCEGMEVTFPLDRSSEEALVDRAIAELRNAMNERGDAQRKLDEWQRMADEGVLQGSALEQCRPEAEAIRKRAFAAVSFYRVRLEQMILDCENDIRAIGAHLELAKKRKEEGVLDASVFTTLQRALIEGQSDNVNTRDFARRAIAARTLQELPHPEGTFLQRMARPETKTGIGPDSWVAWFACALMIVNIFVLMYGLQRGGRMEVPREMAVGLFLLSVLLATSASIPRRLIRGIMINLVWVVSCIGAAFMLQWAWYSVGSVGGALRSDPYWYLRPGMVLLVLCGLIVGLSASLSLSPVKRLRRLPLLSLVVTVLGMAAILSDGAGVFRPRYALDEPGIARSTDNPGRYDVTLTLRNTGFRPVWVGGSVERVPSPIHFLLERQIGSESWDNMSIPVSVLLDGVQRWDAQGRPGLQSRPLQRGGRVAFTYVLPEGSYRARLRPGRRGLAEVLLPFVLDPLPKVEPEESAPPEEIELSSTTENDDAPPETVPPIPAAKQVEVSLQGVINSADRSPSFRLLLRLPDGREVQRNLVLGDLVYGEWRAVEFNPEEKKLTLTEGGKLLVFEPGDTLFLNAAEE